MIPIYCMKIPILVGSIVANLGTVISKFFGKFSYSKSNLFTLPKERFNIRDLRAFLGFVIFSSETRRWSLLVEKHALLEF